jgi:parallel beta-helix repeat protein
MLCNVRKSAATVGLFLIFSLVLAVAPDVKVVDAEASTIVVPDDYSTVQEAINAASEGDTVFVKSGIYFENLFINKSISLVGENKETTTIYRRDQSYPDVYPTLVVREDGVTVTGFTIKNDVSSPSQIPSGAVNAHTGVHLLNVNDCNIFANIITDSGYGVWIYGSDNNNVSNNEITNSNHGIFVEYSSANTLLENTVSDCCTGIVLSSAPFNVLKNNKMINNSWNFGVSGSELSHFINDVDSSNLINGKKVYYLVNKKNLLINPVSFPDLSSLTIVNCTDVTVQNVNINNNYGGLHLVGSSNCTITQSTFSTNAAGGLWLQFAHNCVVSENNVISNTDWGIRVDDSEGILIARNNSTYNQVLSVMLVDSGNNVIVENNVTNLRVNENNGGMKAVYLESSNNNSILNNQIFDDRGLEAITLVDSSYNLVKSNNVTVGAPGIDIHDESTHNEIIGNTFTTDRGSFGVLLSSSFNLLLGNTLNNFGKGIEMSKVTNVSVIGNTMTCKEYCIDFLNSSNNLFCRNNFDREAMHSGTHTKWNFTSVNSWDDGVDGNYWKDYLGTDDNGDGIGDQPYIIDADNQDNHPLMAPITIFDAGTWEGVSYDVDVVSNSNVSDFSFSPEGTISFIVEGEAGTAGFCRVTVPKDLLHTDGNWAVLVDGESVTPTVNEDTINSYIYFTYSHSTKTVEIIGTEAIPEFPSWMPLMFMLVAVMVVAVTYKRKLQKLGRCQR